MSTEGALAQFSQRDAVDELQDAEWRVVAEAAHFGVQHAGHGKIAAETREEMGASVESTSTTSSSAEIT